MWRFPQNHLVSYRLLTTVIGFAITKTMEIREIKNPKQRSQACEAVLRALPEWFGIEAATLQYIESVKDMQTLAAHDGHGVLVGFLSLTYHFEINAEIYVMGVLPSLHRSGVGGTLVESAKQLARQRSAKFLSVKTLSPIREDKAYKKTREFYEALGFFKFEEFANLWGPDNPCLEMVLSL